MPTQRKIFTVQNITEKLKEANKGTDPETVKAAMEDVNKAWSKVSEKLYQQAQSEPQAQPGPEEPPTGASGSKGNDDVEDADFEVVDEK